MGKGGKEKRTKANEAENRPRPGRPSGLPLTEEEKKIKKKEKNKKDRDYRAKKASQLEEYQAFCEEPEIADKFKAFRERKKEFKEELNQLGEVLMKDGTNEDIEMLTGSLVAGSLNVASNCEGELQSSTTWTTPLSAGAMNSTATGGGRGNPFEQPTRELKRKREEELTEARRGKIPASADNYTPHLPIGGSQPIRLMANAPQTSYQSALPGHSSWKAAQQNEEPKWINLPAQKQCDTYVPNCPSSLGPDQTQFPQLDVHSWTTAVRLGMGSGVDPVSLGLHCWKRPPRESCCSAVVICQMLGQNMLEMKESLRQMEDNINAQWSVVAALTQYGSCPQANAPIVSPTEPHHAPLGMQGGTNAAAGSSGGPTTQSFPHNEEGTAEQELELNEQFNKLEEDLQDGFDVDTFLNSLSCETLDSICVGSSNVASGGVNSIATGEPHHDPFGMQGETTAAAQSSGGPTTQ